MIALTLRTSISRQATAMAVTAGLLEDHEVCGPRQRQRVKQCHEPRSEPLWMSLSSCDGNALVSLTIETHDGIGTIE